MTSINASFVLTFVEILNVAFSLLSKSPITHSYVSRLKSSLDTFMISKPNDSKSLKVATRFSAPSGPSFLTVMVQSTTSSLLAE